MHLVLAMSQACGLRHWECSSDSNWWKFLLSRSLHHIFSPLITFIIQLPKEEKLIIILSTRFQLLHPVTNFCLNYVVPLFPDHHPVPLPESTQCFKASHLFSSGSLHLASSAPIPYSLVHPSDASRVIILNLKSGHGRHLKMFPTAQ